MPADQGSLPASPPQTPGFPGNPLPIIWEGYNGLNTKSARPAIKEDELAWSRNFMPVGPSTLRTMWGIGTTLYTASTGLLINQAFFGNSGDTQTQQHAGAPKSFVVLSDGSMVQVTVASGAVKSMMATGTLTTTVVGITQYGNQYIVVVADQPNGYWLWDGTVLYTAGSLAPVVTITASGSGYTSPTITASGGSGTGTTFAATVDSTGIITQIIITNPGSGYKAGETVTLAITDTTGTSATATVKLMPFGIRGTTVETFQGRVWVGFFDEISFSAPGSSYDFSSASGGGSITSSDPFLRVGYTQLKQTNGFLYTIADSSINSISGVSTSGSPLVTTFSNQNADPQIGTSWAATVQVFSRNIVFANSWGVQVSYGGAVAKVSDPLDGVYATVKNFGSFVPSAAVATIFGIQCFMVLLPIIDPFTAQQTRELMVWDGKRWFPATQEVDLTFVASQEVASVLTVWGCDGTRLFPLFNQPSSTLEKVCQSKLFVNPSYLFKKTGNRVAGIVNFYDPTGTVDLFVDSENGSLPTSALVSPAPMTWLTSTGDTMTWLTDSGDVMVWLVGGLALIEPQAASNWGAMLGLTMTTMAPDLALVSLAILAQNFQTKV